MLQGEYPARPTPSDDLLDPDPFSIGLGIFGIIAAGGAFLETRRARQIVERQQSDQFRAAWFACRRTLIHFKRVVDEFETYVLEDNYGRNLFRIGSVRITVDQNRHHALRRLHAQAMTTATFMADNLDDLSDHLGAADQRAVDTLLSHLSEITLPENYTALLRLAREGIKLYSDLLDGIAEREHFESSAS